MQIGVDIGGTFTDIVALDRAGRLTLTKVPSTPKDLLEGIGAAVTQVLALAGARAADVERFIHGTTVATNAVVEQKGAVTGLLEREALRNAVADSVPPAMQKLNLDAFDKGFDYGLQAVSAAAENSRS